MQANRVDVPAEHRRLLELFGAAGPPEPLGSGGEATVYGLDGARVLRIHHAEPAQGAELVAAYRRWAAHPVTTFGLPEVLDSGVRDGLWCQVLRRFPGRTVARWLRVLQGPERARLLDCYLDAAFEIGAIETATAYGPLLGGRAYDSWASCLRDRLAAAEPSLAAALAADVPGFDAVVGWLDGRLPELYDGPPRLVHVDYFPGNVMAERLPDGDGGDGAGRPARFRVSGVFDFASHSLFGDPLLDVVGAVVMADMFTDVSVAEQQAMTVRAGDLAGDLAGGPAGGAHRLDRVFEPYRAFYGLYYAMDPALLPWCAAQLRRAQSARAIR